MGCTFCASTLNGMERNLTAGEMLGQVYKMGNLTHQGIGHIVIMGMGEPLDNYDEVSRFLRIIHDQTGYNLSYRNITISTCGLIPMIDRFALDFPQVNLAVSLHAANDAKRRKLMPIARKYDYESLMNACRRYTEKTGRRISFEYSMIQGENDTESAANELSRRLKGWLTNVNLIPLNKVDERDYVSARSSNILRFKAILEKNGITVTIRRTLGADIDAACGQLRQRR